MPTAKKSVSKKKSKSVKFTAHDHLHEMIDTKTEHLVASPSYPVSQPRNSGARTAVLVVAVLAMLAVYFGGKGYIVAATVNGKPVFRWDVNREMTARFGQQTLENMISEQLIAGEAQKKNISVTSKEVETKMSSVVASLGPNVKLEDLLKYQGMTKADFEHQIRLQLTVEKVLGKDITVGDKEVEDFIAKNKETMTATDEAALRGEAREALRSQKINEKIQPWFAELKKNASIVRLMK